MPHYFAYSDDELAALAAKDKKLGRAIERMGRIEREVQPDLFAALIESIIGQQISGKAATTIKNRLTELCDGRITPEIIENLSDAEIQKCGMSHRKAGYVKAAAATIVNGELDLEKLKELDDETAIKVLTKLPGVGVWTAEMLLIFSLQRRNVFSFGDLAIKRGLCRIHGHKEISRELFEKYRKRYTPYGSIACIYLWQVSGETA
jgi:DNA-3-methyladenine glycosylase II